MFHFENTDDEWMECGALCIRFYNDGQEDYVIIDDFIPLENFNFVFAKALTNELWPIFIEKAYAKKFGSFQAISGGFVSIALSEFTNGIPEDIYFKDIPPTQLWEKMLAMRKEKAFLGAGSPNSPDGDSETSPMGIV